MNANDAAMIQGTFADFRLVKTRSVVQIVIECPIEAGEDIVRKLGFPQPGKEAPVVVALMASTGAAEPEAKQRRPWRDLPPAQQAAMRCNEPAFQKCIAVKSEDQAAGFVRHYCRVSSRADILPGTDAASRWAKLDSHFRAWMQNPDLAPVSPRVEEAA